MNRKDFFRGVGLAGLGLVFPGSRAIALNNREQFDTGSCVLIPSETAGPFPLDLTENSFFFRQDVREDQPGVQLNLRMRILGTENCEPVPNARVHIWHCTNDGVYSGYTTGGNPGNPDDTHLRGYQITDANGEVEFITVFPGWYTGRIAHIHFQVHVSSSYSAVSQLTFPLEEKNAIYEANPSLYPKGTDPLTFSSDGVFSDGHADQLATLEENPSTGGYSSFLEVSIQGSGTTGVGHIERETARVFELGQNVPNPFRESTMVPFTLKQPSNVRLELWDISGKMVAVLLDEIKGAGKHRVEVNSGAVPLPAGNYVYQLVVDTGQGVYRLPRVMTLRG